MIRKWVYWLIALVVFWLLLFGLPDLWKYLTR